MRSVSTGLIEVDLEVAPPLCLSPFRYNTETVSSEVLSCMKQQMTVLNNSTGNHSFLLDDDATLPFAAADVLNALDDKVRHDSRVTCWVVHHMYADCLLSLSSHM